MRITISILLMIAGLTFSLKAAVPPHNTWESLLKQHVTADGKVDYQGFIADSVSLNAYLKTLTDNPPDTATWSDNEQKAYWINAYNAFTVKLITKYYPIKSIKDIGSKAQIPFVNTPWDIKFITIGKEKLDLNNIEHQKLRRRFGDARIHFAIVCASKSCPILLNAAYRADSLDTQLDAQAKAFINDPNRNKVSANAPQLSKLFDWYKMDFTKSGTLIDFLNKYSSVKINANAKITFLNYDWSLNE